MDGKVSRKAKKVLVCGNVKASWLSTDAKNSPDLRETFTDLVD